MFTIQEACRELTKGHYMAYMDCTPEARLSSVVMVRTSDGVKYFPRADVSVRDIINAADKTPGRLVVTTLRALLVGDSLMICESVTVREALAKGYGPSPDGATHMLLMSSGVRLWEQTAWRKIKYWYGGEWVNSELLQVARWMESE